MSNLKPGMSVIVFSKMEKGIWIIIDVEIQGGLAADQISLEESLGFKKPYSGMESQLLEDKLTNGGLEFLLSSVSFPKYSIDEYGIEARRRNRIFIRLPSST